MDIKPSHIQNLAPIIANDCELEHSDAYQLTGLECLELLLNASQDTMPSAYTLEDDVHCKIIDIDVTY